jgi:hypothetical protein
MPARTAKTMTFEELWASAEKADKNNNAPTYHPCCDTWTSRGAEPKKASHSRSIGWRKLLSNLGNKIANKKQALLVKMSEEGWKLPVLFNTACQLQPRQTLHPQTAFRLHQPDLSSHDLQDSFARQEYSLPKPNLSFLQAPGMIYRNQAFRQRPILLFKSKTFKQ